MSRSRLFESLGSRICLSISFLPAVQNDLGAQSLVAAGDVNGDLLPDLIAKSVDGKVRIFYGHGDGRFDTQAARTLSAGPNVTGIALGDFNRDGKLDLACSNGGANTSIAGNIAIFRNVGNGGFSDPSFVFGGADSRAVAAGDFNRDGKLDLLIANAGQWTPPPGASAPTYGAGYLAGRGDGTFFSVQKIPLSGPQHLVAVPAALNATSAAGRNIDVAFGGDLDSAASPVPTAIIYTVKFASTTAPPINSFIPFHGAISGLAVGDLNRDGLLDVVAEQTFATNAGFGDASVYSFVAKPDGTFGEKANVQTVLIHAAGLSLADLDRDGRLDVAVTGEDGRPTASPGAPGMLVALPGSSDGTFGAARMFRSMPIPVSQFLSDLNRDGRIDVVTGNSFGAASLLNSSTHVMPTADRDALFADASVAEAEPSI